MAKPSKREIVKLFRDMFYDHTPDPMTEKAATVRRIADHAEAGLVAIETHGMDCDGVRYSGTTTIVPANYYAVTKEIDEQLAWADGPMGFTIMRPSVADEVSYQSRDLAMEAFENGHPHVLRG